MEFALRLQKLGETTVHLDDTRTSTVLDPDQSVVIADEWCGTTGICLDMWLPHQIAPGDSADLLVYVAIDRQGAVDHEAVYSFQRRIETSAETFTPGRPAPDDMEAYDVELTVRVVPQP